MLVVDWGAPKVNDVAKLWSLEEEGEIVKLWKCSWLLPHKQAGLHNLFHPTIQDGSTSSKFGSRGEHGNVFLFSNLGALWSGQLTMEALQTKNAPLQASHLFQQSYLAFTEYICSKISVLENC